MVSVNARILRRVLGTAYDFNGRHNFISMRPLRVILRVSPLFKINAIGQPTRLMAYRYFNYLWWRLIGPRLKRIRSWYRKIAIAICPYFMALILWSQHSLSLRQLSIYQQVSYLNQLELLLPNDVEIPVTGINQWRGFCVSSDCHCFDSVACSVSVD